MSKRKRFLLGLGALCASWFLIHTTLILADGLRDNLKPADAAVVLGNRVEPSGVPSPALRVRLDKGLELYRNGTVKNIIVSGGVGKEGFDEATVMRDYLTARGVPAMNILADHSGDDTFLTAEHTKQLMQAHDFRSVVIVSHYYHISRVKLAFAQVGIPNVYSAHASSGFDAAAIYSTTREFFAYYYYLVRYQET